MSNRRDSDCLEPTISGYQLVGDSQLVRFSEQLLKKARRKSNGLAYIGLCVSGQKIGDLLQRVQDNFYPTSERAVLMIGTNDLLQSTSIQKMRADIESLVLELIERGVRKLIVLTIPPVPRLAASYDHWQRLKDFNNHIKTLHNGQDVVVIDAYARFVKKSYRRRDSRSSLSSYDASPKRRSSSASSLIFPNISSPLEMQPLHTNLRISVSSPEVGKKREVYVLDDSDHHRSLNSSSAGSVCSDTYSPSPGKRRGDFSPPPHAKRQMRTSYIEDDHDDRFCEEDSITRDSDLVDDINLDLFEEYFSQSAGRKDLIHLNNEGLRIIRRLIMNYIES